MYASLETVHCPPQGGFFYAIMRMYTGGFMNIKFTDDQLDRFNQALDRAMDCPFIQEDDETWDDLAALQEILNQCV